MLRRQNKLNQIRFNLNKRRKDVKDKMNKRLQKQYNISNNHD